MRFSFYEQGVFVISYAAYHIWLAKMPQDLAPSSRRRPSRPAWDIPAVRAELERRGITVTGLSVERGFNRSAVTTALRRPWPAIERIIAHAIGVSPAEIWPERYDGDGSPLRARGRQSSVHSAARKQRPSR